ncbi:hypothetical protein [Heyndrickxia coagulans]|uniref:hypothetical protein n=1 Tax=Heyndrickxia coagulans TaxID=1398 RepID=UPI000779BF63|nr:hypothetical protein [Heyndrickxia coagulans]
MNNKIVADLIDEVLYRLKWRYYEFKQNPNYYADTQRPYKVIDDWLNEYTGNIIDEQFGDEYFYEETYSDILPDIIHYVIYREPPFSLYGVKGVDKRALMFKVEYIIRDLPIEKLETR